MKDSKQMPQGYKPTSLGPIPNDWEVKELKTLVEKVGSGITPAGGEKVYKKEGRLFLRSQNVGWGTLLLDDVAFIDEETHDSFKSTELKLEDVLLNITGASIGRSTIADKRVVGGNVNQHVCIVRPNKSLNPFFLNSFLLSQKGQNLIDSYQAGGNRQGLNFEQIRSFKIPVPSLKEQVAIASLLNTWDKAIHILTQLIAKREQRKKWLMRQLLTGKKRLKGFRGKFEEYRIHQLFEIADRYVEWNEKEFYKLVSIRRRFGGLFYRDELLGEQISVKKLKRVYANDFLISKRQVSHGAWVVASKEFHDAKVSDEYDCLIIREKRRLTSSFWSWYCQQPIMVHYAFLDSVGVHIEKLIFDYDQFKKRKVLIPSTTEEQKAITDVLNSMDSELNLLNRKKGMIEEQKEGLMQMLLTGKKRLKI